MRLLSAFLIILGILSVAIVDAAPTQYIRPGDAWRYTRKDLLPEQAASFTLNDTRWRIGRAPFSSTRSGDFARRTDWLLNTSFWVRKSVNISSPADLKAYIAVDNGFECYWNGVFIHKEYGASTYRWQYNFSVPSSMVRRGRNVIAIRLIDSGGVAVFDMKLLKSPGISTEEGAAFNPDNRHYYRIVSTPHGITWGEANISALRTKYRRMRGHLATITSARENAFVLKRLKDSGGVSAWFWLGGYQPAGSREPDGGWRWVTGEKWSFTNWAPREPSNGENRENALEFRPDGLWNDKRDDASDSRIGYLVEFEPETGPR